jgi:hypothetical protein
MNKGDISAGTGGEAPYFMTFGFKRLLVGLRSNFRDYAIGYDLRTAGVDPSRWHHVAASFRAATRTLTLYLDAAQVASNRLATISVGNGLPVELGRNGPVSGKYFHGKLDDVRIWNVVRSAADIRTNFGIELASVPAGLVANWRFNEGSGLTAADRSGNQQATLKGGAAFSTDVHP